MTNFDKSIEYQDEKIISGENIILTTDIFLGRIRAYILNLIEPIGTNCG